jgi:hypothetical protein
MATPEFILELRQMIGHYPLWLPGVTALVVDERGFVLMGQRSDNGRWALPSGIAEPGEEMAAACAREVLEETGFVDHFFRCRLVSGTALVGDDESLAVGWFDLAGLPEPGISRTAALLALAEKHAVTGRTHF